MSTNQSGQGQRLRSSEQGQAPKSTSPVVEKLPGGLSNKDSLKLQLYDKINDLAKTRMEGLEKEMSEALGSTKLEDVSVFDLSKVHDGKIPVR